MSHDEDECHCMTVSVILSSEVKSFPDSITLAEYHNLKEVEVMTCPASEGRPKADLLG